MEPKVLSYGKTYINENAFHKETNSINKIILFDKGSFKYYIRYMYNSEDFPSPLCIKRPHLMGYNKYFNNDN